MKKSRGMGVISPQKEPKTTFKRDGNEPVKLYARGGGVERKGKTKGTFK